MEASMNQKKKPSKLMLLCYKIGQYFKVPANTILVLGCLALLYFTIYPTIILIRSTFEVRGVAFRYRIRLKNRGTNIILVETSFRLKRVLHVFVGTVIEFCADVPISGHHSHFIWRNCRFSYHEN